MRFKHSVAALAALSFSAISFAQAAPAPEFTAAGFRGHVAFLSDDMLEGRDAGTRGYDLAARYVATQFEGLGLKPASAAGWYQNFELGQYAIDKDAPATITIGGTTFKNRDGIAINPSPREPALSLSAPAVFAGYGIDAPKHGFNDYAGLDVKGKVVVVLTGTPSGTPSELNAHFNSEKAAMAEKRGAIGLLTISPEGEKGFRSFGGWPRTTWLDGKGQPYVATPGIRFTANLGTPATEALFAGAKTSLKAIAAEAAKQGGRPKGFALKQPVKVEAKTTHNSFKSENVVAVLPGSDPALANEYVLLMAHLDGLGVDPRATGKDTIRNGAMDNATGIATLLEVARVMMASPNKPRRSILLAAVTAEEDGLIGSQYLAKNPVIGSGEVVSVVNLDMPILTYDFKDLLAFGSEHSTMGPIVQRAAASMGVTLSPDPLPKETLFVRSDHYRFVQEGVPSVFLMTGFQGEGEERFTHYLHNEYHSIDDQMSLPFNWEAGAKFARINYLIAREIADAPERPRWYAGDFFGDMFAGGQPRAGR